MLSHLLQRQSLLVVAIAICVNISPAASQSLAALDAEKAMEFVRTGLGEVIAVLQERKTSKKEKTSRLRRLLRRDFDMAAVGRFALGEYRRKISKAKLEKYQRAFEEHVVETYIARLVQFVGPPLAKLAGDIIKVTGTRPAGRRDLFVRTSIVKVGATDVAVDWRVREKKGRMKIIDAYFMGVSLALAYRQEFASVISKRGRGVDGLIAALEEKSIARKLTP